MFAKYLVKGGVGEEREGRERAFVGKNMYQQRASVTIVTSRASSTINQQTCSQDFVITPSTAPAMPAVRQDKKRRGLYVHNPLKPSIAISTSTSAPTRLRKHQLSLSVADESAVNGVDEHPLDGPLVEDPPETPHAEPACVSGIRLKGKAKRYANSVRFFCFLCRTSHPYGSPFFRICL